MNKSRNKVFISYSRADIAVANRIADALEAAGLDVWIDHRCVEPGESFVSKLEQGLEAAAYVLLLVSRASLASPWVEREWRSTLAEQETVLLPVRLEPVDLPRILLDIKYVDLSTDLDAGIASLVRFFAREQSPLPQLESQFRGLRGPLSTATRAEIRKVAKRCMTALSLREILWDLEISDGELAGESLHERLVCLLERLDGDGLMPKFLRWLEEERGLCVQTQLANLRAQQEP